MNLKGLFQELNPSKLLVYQSLFVFVVLLGLQIDDIIAWSHFVIFLPLWIWKLVVLSGAAVGVYTWVQHPEYRRDSSLEFHAMMISTAFHILLLLFEILLCLNMEKHWLPYRLVFTPLFCMSALAIAGCIWGFRHDRQLEFETFFSVNILQFICLSLKLDRVISWSWMVVFVPVWIVLTLLSVVVFYYIVWALLFMRSPDLTATQRKAHVLNASMAFLMVIPLLVFVVVLSQKLDGDSSAAYSVAMLPLEVSLLSLTVASFYQKGGNKWWFGMRKECCEFLLDLCPCLREYGNVTYNMSDTLARHPSTATTADNSTSSEASVSTGRQKKAQENRIDATVMYIDVPD